MKNKLLIVMFAMSAAFTSCRQGEDGVVGPAGVAGINDLNKQGSVSGAYTYSYYDSYNDANVDVEIPFNFEYYESEQDNIYDYAIDNQSQQVVSHTYYFSRRSLKDNQDFINIGYSYGVPSGPIPSDFTIELGISEVLGKGVFGFRSYCRFDNIYDYSTLVISNYDFNASTGALKFDFEMDIDPSAIGYGYNYNASENPKVVGKVNVILKKQLNGSSGQPF